MPNRARNLHREGNTIFLDGGTEVVTEIAADQPIYVLRTTTADDDPTSVDVMDGEMLTIRQVAEDGTVNMVCISPIMCVELAKLIDGFLYLSADQRMAQIEGGALLENFR